jgi:SPP1 family predicted phage head-tail adaptor
MQSGKLDKRITIQSQSTTQDSIGELVTVWSTVCVVAASIKDLSGREFIAAGATVDTVLTQIEIRYRTDITAAMRVIVGSVNYNIETVLNQNSKSLLLMCKKLS